MKRNFEHCFSHLEDNEESAAECIHCLKKHGEKILFDDVEKRLKMGREAYDRKYAGEMKTLTQILGVSTREKYEEMDRKYNLTMY